mmetsp:Transcript_24083/g.65927  ORF Transcript_24083/g.65927 Transcript_24083/m.65927 type:complete len:201 (-) Transcript_24083:1050-1652(-)
MMVSASPYLHAKKSMNPYAVLATMKRLLFMLASFSDRFISRFAPVIIPSLRVALRDLTSTVEFLCKSVRSHVASFSFVVTALLTSKIWKVCRRSSQLQDMAMITSLSQAPRAVCACMASHKHHDREKMAPCLSSSITTRSEPCRISLINGSSPGLRSRCWFTQRTSIHTNTSSTLVRRLSTYSWTAVSVSTKLQDQVWMT